MIKKIKVVFIIPSLKAGGAEHITTTIAKNINKTKFEVYLIVLNASDPFFTFLKDDKVNLIKLNIKRVRYSIIHIVHAICSIKPNIVFSTISHLNTYLGLFKPFLFHKANLIIRESNVLKALFDTSINPKAKYLLKLQKRAYSNATKVVCQSHAMKEEMISILDISVNKLNVIYNPVYFIPYENNNKTPRFDLLAVGNFSKIKGYKRMLQTIAKLSNEGLTLGIIGDGSEREKIEQTIEELNLKNRVNLLGKQKNPYKYMDKAKLLIITSYYEGFPNVVLEAGLIGLPVVGFNMPGGISEIIENYKNGILVENGNLDLLAQTIENALGFGFIENDIKAMTKTKFDLKKIIYEYEDLFHSIT